MKDSQFVLSFIKFLREKNNPTYSVGYWDQIPEILHPLLKKVIWSYRIKEYYEMQYEDVKINYEINLLYLQDWQHLFNDSAAKENKTKVFEEFRKNGYEIETWIKPFHSIALIG
jgi:hypothetical protein